jgi:nucleoside-triphosphatase
MKRSMRKELSIITGPKGAGKSSYCAVLASRLQSKGRSPAGLLSPAVFEQGEKIRIDLLDLVSRERRPLAIHRTTESEGVPTGEWLFNAATLDWGNQILREISECEFLILDELGPLEFNQGLGLMEGMKLIDECRFQRAYVVIRPELLETALERWPLAEVIDVSAEPSPIRKNV